MYLKQEGKISVEFKDETFLHHSHEIFDYAEITAENVPC